jgi:hypothetical protein
MDVKYMKEIKETEEMLEKTRVKLYTMLDSDDFTYEEIVSVSQELDKLILSYYKLSSLNLSKELPKL